jgi:glycosyltransferase involved in cell wall biosynthesis
MRVACIGPVSPELGGATPGGVATHQVALADALAAAGVEVSLLATNARADAPDEPPSPCHGWLLYRAFAPASLRGWTDARYLDAIGAEPLLRYLPRVASAAPELGSRRDLLANRLWYRRFLRATRPDVIHVQHPLERLSTARAVLDAEQRRPPLVATLHSFFGEHSDATIRTQMGPNLPFADRLIAVSPHIAEQAIELGADPSRLNVIRSGVDVSRFRPGDQRAARAALALDPDVPLVLFVGNLERRKGVQRLILAMAMLRKELPTVQLAIVGSGESAGSDNQEPRLRRAVGEQGLQDAVRFVGRTSPTDLLHWYAAANAFALPSSSEAQGIVALEAMATSLPVVASCVGGLIGTIDDGDTGYLVPAGDVEALTARLRLLLTDREAAQAMGARARAAVASRFSWAETARATRRIYEQALAPGPPSRRVLAIALGEYQAEAERTLAARFAGAERHWLDRTLLSRRPLRALATLGWQRWDDAVLIAPDLRMRRLRLTGLLASLPRAHRRWLLDLYGEAQPFTLGAHVSAHGRTLVRHTAAIAVAGVGAPLLYRLADRLVATGAGRRKHGRPRRILYLRSQFWLGLRGGGSVAHTAGVIGGLQAAGVDVQVVSSDPLLGVDAPTTIVAPECWFDGKLRDLEQVVYNVPFTRAVLAAARRLRPDAIYQRYAAFNCSGAVVARLLGIPLVLEFNSSEVWKGRHWGDARLLRLAELAERLNLRAADWILVVSTALRDQLVADGVPAERIVVNPNAVDPARFRPDAESSVRSGYGLNGQVVVGFAGTFGLWHGVPSLAEAIPLACAAYPELRILLIGDGPLRPLVDRAIAKHGLARRVIQTGLVPHSDMPAYLAACDVLVAPHGRQADGGEFFGSPTKLYEYLATGRPVVASNVGQLGQVIRDGETGLLVPPDDPQALADAIVRLAGEPALRARLGAAGRAQVEHGHTWHDNAQRVLQLFDG